MSNSRVVRKMPAVMLGFLLCLGAMLLSGLFSARAFDTKTGTIGTCTWEYKDEGNGDVTFRLYPTSGTEGTASWTGDRPDYNSATYSDYYSKVTRVIIDKPVKITTAAGMFWDFKKVRAADLSGLIADEAVKTTRMFQDCSSLTSVNLRGLKTGKMMDLSLMFRGCENLKHVDVTGWDVSNVLWMNFMFHNCKRLEKITGMETWTWGDNPKLQEARGVFKDCSHLKEIDMSRFRTDNVIIMQEMFQGCQALPFLDVGSWNVENVETLESTFRSCKALKEIKGIGEWKTRNIKTLRRTFSEATSIKELDLNKWDVSLCRDFFAVFEWCLSLERLEVNNWDVSRGTDFAGMFFSCPALTELNVSNWKLKGREMKWEQLFSVCRGPYTQDPDNETGRVANLRYLDISGPGWDSSHVKWNSMGDFIMADSLCILKASNQLNLDRNSDGSTLREKFAGASVYTGSKSGTLWKQVDEARGGTIDNPVGETFTSTRALGRFNSQNPPYHVETYVRLSPSQYFLFDKNSLEATGRMESQIIAPDAKGNIQASTFSYSGHRMVSWNTKPDGTGTKYDIGQEYTNTGSNNKPPIVLYAQWDVNKYNIAFDANAPAGITPGGTAMPPKNNVAYGEKVKLPKNTFTVSDHDFAGWALNKEGTGTIYTDEQEVSNLSNENGATVTLYAQWFKHGQKYIIKFDHNKPADATSSGGVMGDQEVTYGQDATLNKNKFTCGNYGFVGWSKVKNGTEADFIADSAPIKNVLTRPSPTTITLYAQWNKKRSGCTVKFDANVPQGDTLTGGPMKPIMIWEGEEKTLPPNNFSCSNHKFLCWTTDKAGLDGNYYKDQQKVSSIAISPSQPEITLYAQWVEPTQVYDIHFDKNEPRDGHVDGNMRSLPAEYGKKVKLLENKYKCKDYDFLGWSKTSDGSGEDFFQDAATVECLVARPPQGKVTLYAQWARHGQSYTINFDKNNSNATGNMGSLAAKHGEPIELTANGFSLSGHAFLCWSTEKTESPTAKYFQDKEKVSRLITRPSQTSVTLYALWIKNDQRYTITFDRNDPEKDKAKGQMAPINDVVYGQNVSLPKCDFKCDGYKFLGWSRAKEGDEKDFLADGATTKNLVIQPPRDRVTLYAQWIKIGQKYTITFDRNDPEKDKAKGKMDSIDVAYGQDVPLPKCNFKCDGYTFLGWRRTKDDSEKDFFADGATVKNLIVRLPRNKVTLYARWIKNGTPYTLNYDANYPSDATNQKTETMPSKTMHFGTEEKLAKNIFACDNYVFVGWRKTSDKSGEEFFQDQATVKDLATTPPFEEVTLYAEWVNKGKAYTLKYDPNYPSDATNPKTETMPPKTMHFGTEEKLDRSTYACDNYVFVGWRRTKDKSGEEFFQDQAKVRDLVKTPPFEEITLYAQWVNKGKAYTLKYNANYPSDATNKKVVTMEPKTMHFGTEEQLAKNIFACDNYMFVGWRKTKDKSGEEFFQDQATVKDLATTPPFEEVTLYAEWVNKGKAYTLKYDSNYPSDATNQKTETMPPKTMHFGTEEKLDKNTYACDNFVFVGWRRTKDKSGEEFFQDQAKVRDLVKTPPFEEITLYAEWVNKGKAYTLKYNANYPSDATNKKSETMPPKTMHFGTEEKLDKNIYACDNYVFVGWRKTSDKSGEEFFQDQATVKDLATTPPFEEITLYAEWVNKGKAYTLKYDPNYPSGATNPKTETMPPKTMHFGTEEKLDKNTYACDNYVFVGWRRTKDKSGEEFFQDQAKVRDLVKTPPFEEITLYAEWVNKGKAYTLKYNANYPSDATNKKTETMPTKTMHFGTEEKLDKNIYACDNYVFVGWRKTSDKSGEEFFQDQATVKDLATTPPFEEITLYAEWVNKGKAYTLKYNANYPSDATNKKSETMPPKTMHFGTEEKLDKNIYACDNYVFVGWRKTSDKSGEEFFQDQATVKDLATTPPFEEITLYAEWENKGKAYTLKYDPNYPSDATNQKTETMPTKTMHFGTEEKLDKNTYACDNYVFVGWRRTSDKSGEEFFQDQATVKDLATTPPFDKVTLYAEWVNKGKAYTLKYDPNYPSDATNQKMETMPPKTMHFGTEEKLDKNTYACDNYVFVGWRKTKDKSGEEFFQDQAKVKDLVKTPPFEEVTLYAEWVEKGKAYTLKYNANYPSDATNQKTETMPPKTMHFGTEEKLAKNIFACDNYVFVGWRKTSDKSGEEFFQDQATVKDLATTPPFEEITLYAEWENKGKAYTLKYNANYPSDATNKKSETMPPKTMHFGTEEKLDKNIYACDNYVFVGWRKTSDKSGEEFFQDQAKVKDLVKTPPFEEITLYAEWVNKGKAYTLKYDPNYPSDATNQKTETMPPKTMHFGTEEKLDKNTYACDNYVFVGWRRTKDKSGEEFFQDQAKVKDLVKTPPFEEITLYAEWENKGKAYTLKYNANYPSDATNPKTETMPPKTMHFGTEEKLAKNIYACDNYVFVGWRRTKDKSGEEFFQDQAKVKDLVKTPPFEEVTLYAQWENKGKAYTLKYDPNYPSDATNPKTETMPPKTMHFGTEEKLDKNTYACDNYVFVGWRRTKDKSGEEFFQDQATVKDLATTPPFEEVTLYAEWVNKGKAYTLKYNANYPSDATNQKTETMPPKTMHFGTEEKLDKNTYACDNYVFVGWRRTKDKSGEEFFQDQAKVKDLATTPPFEEVTLYAEWVNKGKAYTLKYDPNYPSDATNQKTETMPPKTMHFGTEEKLDKNTYACDNYMFVGWRKTSDKSGEEFFQDQATVKDLATTPPFEEVTLYAEWVNKGKAYTLKYNANYPSDATNQKTETMPPKTMHFGTEEKLDKNIYACDNYVFVGWRKTSDKSGEEFFQDQAKVKDLVKTPPFEEITLYAEWVNKGKAYTLKYNANYPSDATNPKTETMPPKTMHFGTEEKLDKNIYACDNYMFVGWRRTKDKSGEEFFQDQAKVKDLATTPPFEEVTLYAEWVNKGKAYTLKYNANYPSDATNQKTETMPPKTMHFGTEEKLDKNTYACDNYMFVGWRKTSDKSGEEFFQDQATVKDLATTPPFEEVTLYAEWVEKGKAYTLKYDPNYPSDATNQKTETMPPKTMHFGTEEKLDKNTYACDNYVFVGWRRTKDKSGEEFFQDQAKVKDLATTPPFEEVTLYAEWVNKGKAYTLKYDPNYPSDATNQKTETMPPKTMHFGTEEKLDKNTYACDNYVFVGWRRTKDKSGEEFFQDQAKVKDLVKTPPFEEITLYAEWVNKGKAYTLKYNANYPSDATNKKSETMPPKTMHFGTEEKLDKNIYACDNYVFVGWRKTSDKSGEEFFQDQATVKDLATTPPFEEITLYAEWVNKGKAYTLKYNANYPSDATNPKTETMPPKTMHFGTEEKLDKNTYACDNYVFVGWRRTSDKSGEEFFQDQATVKDLATTPPFEEVTLYAEWVNKGKAYTLKYDPNYPSDATNQKMETMPPKTMHFGTEEKLDKNTYACDNYVFVGWRRTSDKSGEEFFQDQAKVKDLVKTPSFEEITLYAEWVNKGKAYTLKYNANYPSDATNKKSETMPPKTMHFGTEEKLDKNIYACDNYVFVGWRKTSDKSGEEFFQDQATVKDLATTPPFEEITLYAEWVNKGKAYTLKYDPNYPSGATNPKTETMPPKTMHFGTEEKLDKNTYACDNYVFVGWRRIKDKSGEEFFQDQAKVKDLVKTPPFEEITLYAEWVNKGKAYTLKYNANYPSDATNQKTETMPPKTMHFGTEEKLDKNTYACDNYVFVGWRRTKDKSGEEFFQDQAKVKDLATTPPFEEVTLYAEWVNKGKAYTLKYDPNYPSDATNKKSETMPPKTMHFGTEEKLDKNTYACDNYVFVGWRRTSDKSGEEFFQDQAKVKDLVKTPPFEEVTLYAEWENKGKAYTLKYDPNYPSDATNPKTETMPPKTMHFGTEEKLDKNTYACDNYVFVGWRRTKDKSGEEFFQDQAKVKDLVKTPPFEEVTLYAEWVNKGKAYTLKYDPNYPSDATNPKTETMPPKTMHFGTEEKLDKNTYACDNYVFVGWRRTKDKSGEEFFQDQAKVKDLVKTPPFEEVTLYAEWENKGKAYTLKYNANYPSDATNQKTETMPPKTMHFGTEEKLDKNTYACDNYVFVGWRRTKDKSGEEFFQDQAKVKDLVKTPPFEEITLYAEWVNKGKAYTLKYNANYSSDATNQKTETMPPKTMHFGTEEKLDKNTYACDNYVFVGWRRTKDKSGEEFFQDQATVKDLATTPPFEEVTLYAEWVNKGKAYTLKYNANYPSDATNQKTETMPPKTMHFGTEEKLDKNTYACDNYVFVGWRRTKDKSGEEFFQDQAKVRDLATTPPFEEVTLYAEWVNKGKAYTLKYDPNYPSDATNQKTETMPPKTMHFGTEEKLDKNTYACDNYVFVGWRRTKDKSGEEFFQDQATVKDLATTPPFEEVTLYAEWVEKGKAYTLKYDPNYPSDATNPKTETMPPKTMHFGTEEKLDKNTYACDNYVFVGWRRTKDKSGEEFFQDQAKVKDLVKTPPFEEITLYAEWVNKGKAYTLKYNANYPSDATNPKTETMPPKTMHFGTEEKLDKNTYACDNYVFVGWRRTSDKSGEEFFQDQAKVKDLATTPPFEEVTLYAEWVNKGKAYTLKYDPNYPSDATNPKTETMPPKTMHFGTEEKLDKNTYACDNYVFVGWRRTKDKSGEEFFQDQAKVKDLVKTPPFEEITLYAEWENKGKAYTLKYNANYPSDATNPKTETMPPKTMHFGTEEKLAKNIYACDNYVFVGWRKTSDKSGEEFFQDQATVKDLATTPPFEEVTLYAEWVNKGKAYTLKYDPNYPSDATNQKTETMPPKTMHFGTEEKLAKNIYACDNYVFVGWRKTSDKSGEEFFQDQAKVKDLVKTPPFEEVTLYAEWVNKGKAYTLKYNANYPSDATNPKTETMPPKTMHFGTEEKLDKNTYACDNYVFVGWRRTKDKSGEEFFQDQAKVKDLVKTPPFEEITLYAEWENKGKAYTLKYDPNYPSDATNQKTETMPPKTMHFGTEEKLDKNTYACDNYVFVGWRRTKDKSGEEFFQDQAKVKDLVKTPPFEEVTLYAEWENKGKAYTLKYNANYPSDATNPKTETMPPKTMHFGTEEKLAKNIYACDNYVFVGWRRTKDKSGEEFFQDQATVKDLATTLPFEEVTLYAEWVNKGKAYTLKYDPNYPSDATNQKTETMPPKTMHFGTEEKLDKNTYACDNYVFVGWRRTKDKSGEEFFQDQAKVKDLVKTPPFEEITLYAEWENKGKAYTLKYNANYPSDATNKKSETMPPKTMHFGTEEKLDKNIYACDNYVFVGWRKTSDKSGEEFFQDQATVKDLATTPPFEEVTLYAEWENKGKAYTLKYDPNYPSDATNQKTETMPPKTMHFGTEEKLDKNTYACDNYVFVGWRRTKDKSGEEFFQDQAKVKDLATTPPFDKVTLYARWIKSGTPYDISFDANYPAGTARHFGSMPDQRVEYGKEEKLFKNKYVCSGYTFLGWSRIQEGSEQDFFEDEASVKNLAVPPSIDRVTLYAQWGVGTRIAYSATKGGSVLRAYEMIKDGVEPKGSTVQPDEGYRFVKWTCDIDPDWSCTRVALGTEEIKAVAQADDGTFLGVSFKAHFRSNSLLPEDIFTVTFDKNDSRARGEMRTETFLRDYPATLPVCAFTKEGYEFAYWNTKADGTGISFSDKAEINFDGDPSITLYAQWQKVDDDGGEDGGSGYSGGGGYGGRGDEDRGDGWQRHDGSAFCYKDGRKLIGWHELSGTIQDPSSPKKNWFYFGGDGAMLTGRHKLVGGLPNPQGIQEQHWFGLDEQTGAQLRGWHKTGSGSSEKWYYYRPEDGAGLVGRHHIVGGFANARGVQEMNWFFFDLGTGAEIRGWHGIVENGVENWYYYRDGDGIMLKGQHELAGGFDQHMNWFYFDEVTGIEVRGWKYIDYQDKWCYYRDGDGIMLKGQHRLQGGDDGGMNWFYFDEETGAELRNTWKYIDYQDKTCYYGADGAMYKGWSWIDGRGYYFNEDTGALS